MTHPDELTGGQVGASTDLFVFPVASSPPVELAADAGTQVHGTTETVSHQLPFLAR
jgi:hypothetical protein